MKKTAAILAALAVLTLSGCSNEADSDSQNSSEIFWEADPDNPANENPVGEPTILYGLAGDRIYTGDIETVFTGDDTGGAELYSEEFTAINCKDFIYLAAPSGKCFNNRDNADIYDEAGMSFEGVPGGSFKDYVRVNVGDTFCGLTLRSAKTNFQSKEEYVFFTSDGSVKTAAELPFPEIYFSGGECEFDGQLELSGYACAVAADVYGIAAGDIVFLPGEGCTLPVISYSFDPDVGFCHEFHTKADFGMVWSCEYGNIFLGNTGTTAADVSLLPEDGSFVKVKVTIDRIAMSSSLDFGDILSAEIVDIKLA